MTASVATRNPRNIEPTVPARMRAGYTLKKRKPAIAPIPIMERIAIGGWKTSGFRLRKKMVTSVMSATPPQSPSTPSSQFIAFITKKNHTKRMPNPGMTKSLYGKIHTPPKGLVSEVIRIPKIKISAVSATWKKTWIFHPSSLKSSHRPKMKISTPPNSKP